MKSITAKEFQLNQSQVMREVAGGVTYEVTYHGKPWVELRPKRAVKRAVPGSMAAFRASLGITLDGTGLPDAPDYKRLRRERLTGRDDF